MHQKVNLRQKLDLFDVYWQPKIVGRFNRQQSARRHSERTLAQPGGLGDRLGPLCSRLQAPV